MSSIDIDKRKSTNKKIFKFFGLAILALIVGSIVIAIVGGSGEPEIDTANALPYTVLSQKKIRKGAGTGIWVSITPSEINLPEEIGKLTTESLGDTVIRASLDLAQHGEKIVSVEIRTDVGNKYASCLASAVYTPDGGGIGGDGDQTLEVRAARNIPTYQQVIINRIWWENRDIFQKNGATDEPAMKQYISQRLKIPVDQVTLPYTDFSIYYEK
ncbi:DUF4875 domain-containing protein [Maridesulfovibrio hydrothermalis]|uniref:DUF4875 domain-containing protein n=1 Tax=Maridesulfovibrio hydrothermalis TaxID=191026 RepID=UPI00047F8F39|nr:DUF4875 domain-containing protein [Maridesulfovibrio hydrothermalis]